MARKSPLRRNGNLFFLKEWPSNFDDESMWGQNLLGKIITYVRQSFADNQDLV